MRPILCILLLGLLCNIFAQSHREKLDEIKKFVPSDKYFKSSLINIHFVRETAGIEKADEQFKNAVSLYNLPLNASECPDGVFTGETPFDAYDYKHVITLEIKDEKIISVDYDEVHISGQGKETDKKYGEEMSMSGTTPAITYPIYEKVLVEKQDPTKIDAVTGASFSLRRLQLATVIALIKAKLSK